MITNMLNSKKNRTKIEGSITSSVSIVMPI